MQDFPQIVSVDDHVVEPPNLWASRLPRRDLETGPRVVRAPMDAFAITGPVTRVHDGLDVDWWRYEDLAVPLWRASAAVGHPREWIALTGTRFDEIRRGCWDPVARVADMDTSGVEASLCFPNVFTRFCGQTFLEARDRALAMRCVLAYNDWMVEEWCAGTGGRLVPLCLVPLWDVGGAVAEVHRNAARGVRAVSFPELPANLGLPSIHDRDGHWEPLFAACAETGTVVCMHIGSGSKMVTTSPDAPHAVLNALVSANASYSLVDWLMSGVLHRHPSLTLAYSEGQIGWMPYILERADAVWFENRGYNEVYAPDRDPPSALFRKHVYGCVFNDPHGLRCIDEIGVDNVTFESDYPHGDSTWPHTQAVAQELTRDLPDDVVRKVMRDNAIRMLGLDLV